jgi:hypothetical protein
VCAHLQDFLLQSQSNYKYTMFEAFNVQKVGPSEEALFALLWTAILDATINKGKVRLKVLVRELTQTFMQRLG